MTELQQLTSAVQLMAQQLGTRLTRAQMCERLGVSDNTLRKIELKPGFPKKDATGKYLLSDVIFWEQSPNYPPKIC